MKESFGCKLNFWWVLLIYIIGTNLWFQVKRAGVQVKKKIKKNKKLQISIYIILANYQLGQKHKYLHLLLYIYLYIYILFNVLKWSNATLKSSINLTFSKLESQLTCGRHNLQIKFFVLIILPPSHFFCPVWKVKFFKGTLFIVLYTF